MARALGFAARFVSGYIYVPDRDVDERHLGGGSTHAWHQIYLPGAGWVEFDPTNGIVGGRDLIRVAVAREAHQAIPLHGSYFGDPADDAGMEVSVLRRLPESAPLATDDRNLSRQGGISDKARLSNASWGADKTAEQRKHEER